MSPSRMARAPVVPARDVRCRHHAWLELRLSLPEMCDIAKVLRDPLVGIDGIEVAFSAVVKNSHARRAPGYAVLHLFYCPEHSSRRAASENGLGLHQAPTTNDTVQVRDPQTLIGQVGAVELGTPGRPVSRNEPLGRLAAENHAAVSIDREDPGAQVLIPNILGAPPERAARTGGPAEAVAPPVPFRRA